MSKPVVSVIIPTYNRRESLQRTLESLAQQTFPADNFEALVIDDGGNQDITKILNKYSFEARYCRQENSGPTVARNYGSQNSQGQILVFIDDDITLNKNALAILAQEVNKRERTIVLGILLIPDHILQSSLFGKIYLSPQNQAHEDQSIPAHDCMTGLLAVKRDDFFSIGLFADPTEGNGWPNWDDVEFGVRAHRQGYQLWRSASAIGYHYDYAAKELETHKERMYRAGRSAVILLQKYPELEKSVPLFHDRSFIAWRQDSSTLILRKLWRSLMGWSFTMALLHWLIQLLEKKAVAPYALRRLYVWYISSSVTIGMRQGIREFGAWQM